MKKAGLVLALLGLGLVGCARAVLAYDPATVAQHPDVNLKIRGWTSTTGVRDLIDLSGPTDTLAPKLNTLVRNDLKPPIGSLWQVYDWSWATNTRGALISDPAVTLVGFSPVSGSVIQVPVAGRKIGGNAQAMVLYADADSVTLKYTAEDTVATGYTIHIVGISVNSAIIAKYNQMNAAGRSTLPTLKACQEVGTAKGADTLVAIRDTGSFMDPRSRKDWWNDQGCDQTFPTNSPTDIGETTPAPGFDPLAQGLVECSGDSPTTPGSGYGPPKEDQPVYGSGSGSGTSGGGIQSNIACAAADDQISDNASQRMQCVNARCSGGGMPGGCSSVPAKAWCNSSQCSGQGARCGICMFGGGNLVITFTNRSSNCPTGFSVVNGQCQISPAWGDPLPALEAGTYKIESHGCYKVETITVHAGCTITGSPSCKDGSDGSLKETCTGAAASGAPQARFGMPSPPPPANLDTVQTYADPIGGKWCVKEQSTPLQIATTYTWMSDLQQACISGNWSAQIKLDPMTINIPFAQDIGQYLVGILDYEHFSPNEISQMFDRVMGIPIVWKATGVSTIWDTGGPINRLAPQLEQDKLKHQFLAWECQKSSSDPMKGRDVKNPPLNTRYPASYYIEAPLFGSNVASSGFLSACQNLYHFPLSDDQWRTVCNAISNGLPTPSIKANICDIYNDSPGVNVIFPVVGVIHFDVGDVYQKKMDSIGLWPPPATNPNIPTKGPMYVPNVAEQAIWDRIPLFANEEAKGVIELNMCQAQYTASNPPPKIPTSIPQIYRLARASNFLQRMLLTASDSALSRKAVNVLDPNGGWPDALEVESSGFGLAPSSDPTGEEQVLANTHYTNWSASRDQGVETNVANKKSETNENAIAATVKSKLSAVSATIKSRIAGVKNQFFWAEAGLISKVVALLPRPLRSTVIVQVMKLPLVSSRFGTVLAAAQCVAANQLPTCEQQFKCPDCDQAQSGPPDTEVFIDYTKNYNDSNRGVTDLTAGLPGSISQRSFQNDCYQEGNPDYWKTTPGCYTLQKESAHYCDNFQSFPAGYHTECYTTQQTKTCYPNNYFFSGGNGVSILCSTLPNYCSGALFQGSCWKMTDQRVPTGVCDNWDSPSAPGYCYQMVPKPVQKNQIVREWVGVWNTVPYLVPSWFQTAGEPYGVFNIQKPYRPASFEPTASQSAGMFWPSGPPFDGQNNFLDTPGSTAVDWSLVNPHVTTGQAGVTAIIQLIRDRWQLLYYRLAGVWNAKNFVVQTQAP